MATTHREGSVFHHEGDRVTHVETGTAPETPAAPPKADEASPAEPEQAPEPVSAHVTKPRKAPRQKDAAKKK